MAAEQSAGDFEASSGDSGYEEVLIVEDLSDDRLRNQIVKMAATLPVYSLDTDSTLAPERADMGSLWLIMAGLALVLLLTAVAVGIFIWHWKKNQTRRNKNAFIDDCLAENIPAPMFEDDVPSVLELDMEDFDKWEMKPRSEEAISLNSGKKK